MVDASPDRALDYRHEAGVFLSTMDEMAPQLGLDYSVESLQRLEGFISEHFEPPGDQAVGETLLVGIGSYLGEVIVRHLGGQWDPDGRAEIHGVGSGEPVFPLERVRRRFENGRQESLVWYYHALVKHVHEAGEQAESPSHGSPLPHVSGKDGGGDMFSFLKGLFGKKA